MRAARPVCARTTACRCGCSTDREVPHAPGPGAQRARKARPGHRRHGIRSTMSRPAPACARVLSGVPGIRRMARTPNVSTTRRRWHRRPRRRADPAAEWRRPCRTRDPAAHRCGGSVQAADAPPFLAQIDQEARRYACHADHGHDRRLAAVAAQGGPALAGETLGAPPATSPNARQQVSSPCPLSKPCKLHAPKAVGRRHCRPGRIRGRRRLNPLASDASSGFCGRTGGDCR